jgi:hypothetical protein
MLLLVSLIRGLRGIQGRKVFLYPLRIDGGRQPIRLVACSNGRIGCGCGEGGRFDQLDSKHRGIVSLRGLGKLLETDNGGIDRSRGPLVVRYERTSDTIISLL